MELRDYLSLLKRWGWLLALGLVAGLLVGVLLTKTTAPVYRATTKMLILSSPQDTTTASDFSNLNNTELANTFSNLLTTNPVIKGTADQLGYPVSAKQISVLKVRDADMIEVNVEDSDPQHAAAIANTLVKVFIEQNRALQATRFATTEESLQAQLQDVQNQIANLQKVASDQSQENLQKQLSDVTNSIADIQAEIHTLQEEIVNINYNVALVPGVNALGQRGLVTPTPSLDQRLQLTHKQDRLLELQSLLSMYQRIYVDLQVNPTNNQAATPRNNDQMQSTLQLYNQIYSNILTNYETVRLARMRSSDNLVQVEEAVPPHTPVRPVLLTNLLMMGLVGLLLAGGTAFVRDNMDDTLRTPNDVTESLDLPILGYIGEYSTTSGQSPAQLPIVLAEPRSPIAEAFRSMRANLEFAASDHPIKTLLVTSPSVSEGKTSIAVNLAIVIAQAGKRVLLLDADLRRPQAHNHLGISNRIGLSDVLQGTASLQSVALSWKRGALSVITSGSLPSNPAELLGSQRMEDVLKELGELFDVVIIDGPPFILADAPMLSARTDGVLAVVRANHTHASAAAAMLDQLERAGARVIGVVLNGVRETETRTYYRKVKDYGKFSYENMEMIPSETKETK
jgi:capsular exopolysaccharide synthesis family protein